ncbi:alkaline phosphatase family protein [Glaciibacter flavus]|uniref:Alkaline phosphatase family protein n=2 Tax=Orlajensenia flava TaxID=2565934 RepID=A0A4S4FZQ5_9MICO|nr:alkaline phosphatase family protein [Glaciibacter flavus]
MVPAAPTPPPRLADVLASCLASALGAPNRLDLPAVRHAVVVLVDGLGAANLRQAAGHARYLSTRFTKRAVITGVFPATTAVGLGSLCTGVDPGQHGLVGYRVLDAANDRVVNQLSGWDDGMVPTVWQPLPTVFERAVAAGVPAYAVGPHRFADSGLSQALLRGAQYVPARSIADRFARASELIASTERALVYVYVPELDMAGHARGWESDRWIGELETLDAEIAAFARTLPSSTGALVTADHGILDVAAEKQVLFDTAPELIANVRHVGGDPRCLYLYIEPDAPHGAVDSLARSWRDLEGHRARVFTRDEAVADGLFGETTDAARSRIGDVVVSARAQIAYYDSRDPNVSARQMIGQHGAFTDDEMRVPCIRLGAFER